MVLKTQTLKFKYNFGATVTQTPCKRPDTTLLTSKFQHCWMLHVASFFTLSYMLLTVAGSCYVKFLHRSNFDATTPNNVASVCTGL